MNKILSISIIGAALFLSACDHYSHKLAAMESSSADITQISPASGGEMSFSGYLANEYLALARYENETRKDYRAAKYYTEKIEQLHQGQMVMPAAPDNFKINQDASAPVKTARQDLIRALQTYNIPENRQALAKAQSRYDCWVDQLEEQREAGAPLTCEMEYKQAMASLAFPYDRDIRYAVPFNEDGSMMNEQASASLGRVLYLWNAHQDKNIQINLLAPYALPPAQSKQQISRVRTILQYNGIPAEQIDVMSAQPDIMVPKNNLEIIMRIDAPPQDVSMIPPVYSR